MEQATKFFGDFNEGLNEVINISDEIKDWFSNVDISNLSESEARKYLMKRHESSESKEYEKLSVAHGRLWFESNVFLGLSWSYWEESDEYAFVIDGYHFDDDAELKSKFRTADGWKVIPCV
ncbi:hypothetical protein ABD87_22575 [Lysinibacillus sphaericus]|uniref:hypothetical protein n=1 Tax=Lysinibacillus sphaericus TaxID=1421 RepID=UPI0018CEB59C|nr:hypothetical protein [Lysinibacillus sphaericus]MBG9732212.1 hypothetical protein [Lysinibacillus sphaericus]